MTKPLMIGDLAAATGTKVNTIRFYEEIGLMPRAARTGSGRRTYGVSDLDQLSFIRHGRALGFSIDEVRSLLELSSAPDEGCADVSELANRHLREIEEKIRRLKQLRGELRRITEACADGRAADCSIITAMAAR